MRISHGELEACEKSTGTWYASAAQATGHGYKMGYERALRLAISRFHRESSARIARKYLAALVKKHNFQNAARVNQIEKALESYIAWADSVELRVAGSEVKISLPMGFLELRGQVGRVDVVKTGYRAVVFGNAPSNWKQQLRLPLIQRAVSDLYSRPVEEVAVGFQNLDGSNLQTEIYTSYQIAAAEKRFRDLGNVVRRLAESRPKIKT